MDVLFLAGQRPAGPGEWLLITAVDGPPGADFLARILPADGRHAHGGDVLVHLAADPGTADPGTGDLEPLGVRVSAWTVLNGLLIPVAHWDRHPVCLPEADVSSQTVTINQRRTVRYPPLRAACD